jgi:large repetitive protein
LTMVGVNLNVCNPPPPPVCSCEGYNPGQQQCGTLGSDSCGNPNKCGPVGTLNCPPPPPVCNCDGYDPSQTQCGALGADSCGNPGVCGPPGLLNCPPPPPPPCTCDGYDPSQTQCGALGTDSCGNVGACAPPGTMNCPPPPPVCNCNNYDPSSTQCGMLGSDSCGNPGVCGPVGTLNCEPPPPPPAPIVTITNTSVGALTNINDITIEFTADVAAAFQCSMDGSALTNCASPFSALDLADGPHHFSVIGIGEGGASVPASYDWSIDTTAPIASIDSTNPSASLTDQTQITFQFSSNEIATFQCRLDSATFVDCSSPFTDSNLLDGPHTFYVRATDLASNTGAEVGYGWTVKTKAPTVQITSVVPNSNPTNINMRTYGFIGSADTVSFVCNLDTSADFACASPYSLMGIADGAHTFRVKAVDALGQKSLPDTESFTIDTIAPIVSIVSAMPPQSPTNSQSIQIAFASDDASSFVCQLDGMTPMACTSPIDIGALSDGLHNFQVVGTDVAGNQSSPAVYGWTVDTLGPVLTITSVSPAGYFISQSNLTLTFSVNETSVVNCEVDGGASSDCSSGSISPSGLSDGVHTITLTPRDDVNNLGATVGYTFSVDTTGPVVEITSVTPAASLTNIANAAISFTSSESVGFRCSLDGSAYAACSSPASYSNLADGGHTFSVIGVDALGNLSAAPASYSWTIDTGAPTVTITSHTPVNSPTNIQSMSLTFVSNEPGSFSCQLDALSWMSCTSPANYNGLADGTHTFKVLATDLAGNTSASKSYTWVIDTVGPTTTITSTSITESPTDATGITVNFTANEASTFECSLDGASFAGCLSPVSYSGLLPGNHTVNVRATDLAGNLDTTGASFSWTITVPPLILTFATPPVTGITTTTATLTWTSNRASTTQGAIRLNVAGSSFTFTSVNTNMLTTHTVTFTGLTPNTSYVVQGISSDGFQSVSTPTTTFRTSR